MDAPASVLVQRASNQLCMTQMKTSGTWFLSDRSKTIPRLFLQKTVCGTNFHKFLYLKYLSFSNVVKLKFFSITLWRSRLSMDFTKVSGQRKSLWQAFPLTKIYVIGPKFFRKVAKTKQFACAWCVQKWNRLNFWVLNMFCELQHYSKADRIPHQRILEHKTICFSWKKSYFLGIGFLELLR